jgi:hypothetical protein
MSSRQPTERHSEPQQRKQAMAYINQEEKTEIAAELKKLVPKGWKYSLSIKHYSTLVFTLAAAPVADLGEHDGKHVQVNHYYPQKYFTPETLPIVEKIIAAMNAKNYCNSDSQRDYVDVGYYVNFNIGRWDKPFVALP